LNLINQFRDNNFIIATSHFFDREESPTARRRGFLYPRDSLFSVATPVDRMLRSLIESSAGTKDQQRAELCPLAEESSFQVKRNTHCRSRNFG